MNNKLLQFITKNTPGGGTHLSLLFTFNAILLFIFCYICNIKRISMIKKYLSLLNLIIFCITATYAQVGIHHWETHAPGMKVISVDVMHEKIFAATPYEVFYYNTGDNSINKLSKVNGLNDFGVNVIRHNPNNDLLFIGYSNTNIDIIDNQGNIKNLSDIKDKNILGNKTINDVYFIEELAYVCCGFGIVVVDMNRNEIRDTYIIGEGGSYLCINDITLYDDKLYAATPEGVYFADYQSENLADFSEWHLDRSMIHDKINYNEIETFNDKLIVNFTENKYNTDTMFIYNGVKWDYFLKDDNSIKREIRSQSDRLILTKQYSVRVLDSNFNNISNFNNSLGPFSTVYDKNRNAYWIGDNTTSLIKMNLDGSRQTIVFDGPFNNLAFEIKAKGDQLWVAPGGYTSTWAKRWLKSGVFYYTNNDWAFINDWNTDALDTISDLVCIAIDPINSSKVYVGTFDNGILEIEDFKLKKIYDNTNSSLGELVGYEYVYITGLDFDSKNNLWAANSGADKMLSVKTTKDEWYSFNIGNGDISHLMVDENDYKWILRRDGSIIVFNDNKTISTNNDDEYKIITNTAGQGGLPQIANCMAVDKNGTVWVGTNDGLGLFYSTSKIFKHGENYDASRILVPRNDGSGQADYLLSGESILSIAVDDANNLWFGTNNGAFYISNNGMTEYHHFTQENSPLLSNSIKDIAIDGNGNVYFATDKGIVSYRGNATEGKTTNSEVIVYPNPVRPEYSGLVGIKNLVPNSLVKITTTDGSFVTHLYAEGGQAVWDCTSIDGKKVKPGVYLIFISDKSGKETFVSKILILG